MLSWATIERRGKVKQIVSRSVGMRDPSPACNLKIDVEGRSLGRPGSCDSVNSLMEVLERRDPGFLGGIYV